MAIIGASVGMMVDVGLGVIVGSSVFVGLDVGEGSDVLVGINVGVAMKKPGIPQLVSNIKTVTLATQRRYFKEITCLLVS